MIRDTHACTVFFEEEILVGELPGKQPLLAAFVFAHFTYDSVRIIADVGIGGVNASAARSRYFFATGDDVVVL